MDKKLAQLVMLAHRVDRRHVQLLFAVAMIALLVLGVGAPADGGGPTSAKFSLGW